MRLWVLIVWVASSSCHAQRAGEGTAAHPPVVVPPDAGAVVDAPTSGAPLPDAAPAPGPVEVHENKSHLGRHRMESTPLLKPPYPPPSISPPSLNSRGCVESAGTYASALASEQTRIRDAELSSMGARWVTRSGFFIDPSTSQQLGQEYSVNGRRFAVVDLREGWDKSPSVSIAQIGGVLHVVEERARSIPVTVRACGMRSCPRGRGTRVHVRPVSIELGKGETLGPPIVLHYDFWWAQLVFEKQRRCPPPPPQARQRG